MPVEITASGSDDNVLAQVATDGGFPVTVRGSVRNQIEQVAQSAAVAVPGQMSDRNAIEALAALIGGYVLALANTWAAMFGKKPAVVDGWSISATGTGEDEIFVGTSDPSHAVQWVSGTRCLEVRPAQDFQEGIWNRQGGFACVAQDWSVSARREGEFGAPGNTHWIFYRERITDPLQVDVLATVASASESVATVGVDAATGNVLAWIDGAPVSLTANANGLFPGGDVVLFSALHFHSGGLGIPAAQEVAAVVGDYQYPIAGAQDMNGAAL